MAFIFYKTAQFPPHILRLVTNLLQYITLKCIETTMTTLKRKKIPYVKWLLIAIVLIALAGLAYYFLKPKEKY